MSAFGPVVQSLASLTVLALLLGFFLGLGLLVPASRHRVRDQVHGAGRALLAAALFVALVATAGSLFLSEVAGLRPCLLCWYQRVAMYPLLPILGIATVRGDSRVWTYVLPLSLVGFAIAAYHVFIQWMPAAAVVTCAADAPCTLRYLSVFGFVSIPVMAGSAFLLISGLVAAAGLSGSDVEQVE